MFIAQKHLSRRTALKGLGRHRGPAASSKPWCRRAPALAKTAASGKVRLAAIEMVHGSAGATVVGLQKNMWSPAATGRATSTLTPTRASRRSTAVPRLPDHRQQHRRA